MRKEPLPSDWVDRFIGGYGINNRLAYQLIPPQVDPLSPENALIIGAGPFAGTLIPGSGKVLLTTKFPINGAFATASGGGSFSFRLKSAGYDHVVITGKSPRPVYLKIDEQGAEICPAEKLWGKDGYQTDDELRAQFEPCSIIPIGQAGENLVKFSLTLVDKVGTLGRGGLASIMGSKNLKAIVALQGGVGITIAHRPWLMKLVDNLHHRMLNWVGRERLLKEGLTFSTEAPLSDLIPQEIKEVYQQSKKQLACPSCPLADKVVVRLKQGEFEGLVTYMAHLFVEGFCGDGAPAYNRCVKLADTLNRYGICHMTFTSLFPLAFRLYQDGLISQDDYGLEMGWDIDTALRLAKMIAYREGLGDILAEGLIGAMERIGRGAERYIQHIKGQAIPWDARIGGLGTMEFEQIVNPRGAHVASGGSPSYNQGRPPADFAKHGERMGIPQEALKRIVTPNSFNPARYTRYSEDWYALFSCLSLCNRAFVNRFYHVQTIAELYSALTGVEVSPQGMMAAAERAWNLGRLLNDRAGFSRRDDKPPPAWFQPKELRGKQYILTDYYKTTVLTPEDVDRFLDEYYEERGYEKDTGKVGKEKLAQLGIEGL